MSVKDVFRKIWLGLTVAAPYIEGAAALLPGGSPAVLVLRALSTLITRAEVLYPASGTGADKAAFVTVRGMQVAEIVTGKNFDSPEGRALVAEYANVEVAARNAQAQLQIVIKKLHDYIDSVNAPAQADTDLSRS